MVNTTEHLENILEEENTNFIDIADGTLLTEDGHSFPIHKYLLARCSKTFSDIFCGTRKDEKDVLIPGVKGEVLSNILTYIYHGRIHVTEENIYDVFVASHYLSLKNLLSEMKNFLHEYISVGNCLDVYLNSLKTDCADFLRKSYRFIETHFADFVYSGHTNFSELPLESLTQFLIDDNLWVENEKVVWHALVKWVEADPTSRLQRVPGLLVYLRPCDVDDNLAFEILTHAIVAGNPFCNIIDFTSTTHYNGVLDFHQCITWIDPTQNLPLFKPRKPSSLNLISGYVEVFQEQSEVEIYVTYDENIDLWRKIVEFEYHPLFLGCVDTFVYAMSFDKKLRYNIIENELVEMSQFRIPRYSFVAVQFDGFLYILGGISFMSLLDDRRAFVHDVEIYDPEENIWRTIGSMKPMYFPFSAATLNGSIYVVGANTAETRMCAQMYNPTTKRWQYLPEPHFTKCMEITLAAYKKNLYAIGAKGADENENNVQVFNPLKNTWKTVQNLPYPYKYPRAFVVNNNLIVSEYPSSNYCPLENPPVQWIDDTDCWEAIDASSPLFNLQHHVFAAQETDYINVISRVNKMSISDFEKSPFL